jgi:hypothetical protein
MKATDLNTIKRLIAEYGMSSGASTPVSQQKSGETAKANKVQKQGSAVGKPSNSQLDKPAQSQMNKKSASPTLDPGTKTPVGNEPQEPTLSAIKDLEKGSAFKDKDGNELEVVDAVGNQGNPEVVVAKDKKGDFVTIDPKDEVEVAVEENNKNFTIKKILKRKNKLQQKIKKVLRAQKYKTQGEPVFEINFNSKELAQGALNAKIACGFEAETVWPNLGEGVDSEDTDWLDDLYWNRVSDLIYDQEGSRALERVEEAYRDWLQEEIIPDIEGDVVLELVNDRKEDEAYIDDFVSDKIDMDEVEEYKAEKLERLEIDDMQDELEEYSDWDMDAWAREYVEMEKDDEFVEWLEEQIRDNGEAWDDAWERAQNEYDMDDWVRREHGGSWYSLLGDYDIYLYNEEAGSGGVDEVASMLEDWASNNSRSNDVRPGGYHSGQGVDNTYWRVEEDSSIEGDGAKAEIISPVYDSPAEMLKEMKSLFEYMDNNDAETNDSTGLHVTMSFPTEDMDDANKLKMAVLLGDKYVLKQFGRERNSYTKSQQETLQKYVKNLQTNIKDQKSLDALEEILLGGISDGKFSSINFKDARNEAGNNLIEFRVAGGEDYHLMSNKVMKAVIRYAAVMQAGHDPEAYRKDYIKALFKMIAGKDTVSGDVVKRAQTMVDPESINDKVLAAFQSIASEKHYTDAIEALSNAYMQLKDAQAKRNSNPQQELQFEDEGDEEDWRRDMIVAQKYFVRAFAMLASDVASGANRAKPTAAVIASLRQALKDFNMTPKILWDELQKSEFYTRFPGQVHDKSEKFASAVNSLLKKQDAKALEPAFTVKFNPATQRMFMPGPIADAVNTASGNNIFGRDGDAGQLPAQFTPKMFKVIDDSEYNNVREARWDYETALEQHNQQLEIIQSFKDSIKQNPERADHYKEAMAHRLADVEKLKKQMEPSQKAMDAFKSKYGFVPPSVRSRSETTGNEWKLVSIDDLSWLSSNHNIKFTATESVFDRFDKLPLAEQLNIIGKVDKRKLDEAWSKKKKIIETIEADQDMAALLTAYGTPKKKKKAKKVKEGAVPDRNIKRDYREIMSKPLLGSDLQGQMNAYFAVPNPAMVKEFRRAIAEGGNTVDLRVIFDSFAKASLHPTAKKKAGIKESKLTESRGVTARQPGEQYVNVSDPADVLTLQSVDILPTEGVAYESSEEMLQAVAAAIPGGSQRIDDNMYNKSTQAAIIATVTDAEGTPQYWVRYIKSVPDAGVDGLWKTLKGYRYSKGAEKESVPLKPTDVLTANKFMGADELAKDIAGTINKKFADTQYEPLVAVMEEAVQKARNNDSSPVANSAQYMNVLVKYGGEYLGPLALIDGGSMEGDTPKMLQAYNLPSLKGSQVMFPEDVAYELVDSLIRTPDGQDIGISSKAHKGGGAASSLSGIVKQLTPEIEKKYPQGTKIIKIIGTESAIQGPLLAALEVGVLNQEDVRAVLNLNKSSQDINDIASKRVQELVKNQGVADANDPNYRIIWHTLTAVVNAIIPVINSNKEFIGAMKEALNNNNFLQLMTNGKKVGDGVSLTYYTKYPAVFEGSPQLYNKSYYATGQKGRLGFKLKK